MKKFLTAVVLAMAMATMISGTTVQAQAACTETEIISLVNQERTAAGLKPLVQDKELTQAAKVRAEEASRKFSHTRPDGTDYYTVNPVIVYGENLAKGSSELSSADMVQAWMDSPGHRANVLTKDSSAMGIAIFELNGQTYIAQEFN